MGSIYTAAVVSEEISCHIDQYIFFHMAYSSQIVRWKSKISDTVYILSHSVFGSKTLTTAMLEPVS